MSMKCFSLERTQFLPVSLESAWEFFSSPLNLPSITPPWLNLKVRGEVPDRMVPGMVIYYRVKPLLGIPVTWISEITQLNPPHGFVDEQRVGPYRFWHHRHLFRPLRGGIEMIDQVTYSLKYGPVGTLVHAVFVRKRLKEIFDFRQAALERRFGCREG